MRTIILKSCLTLAAVAALGLPASAQTMSGAANKNIIGKPKTETKIAPPPAVPGAVARAGTVVAVDRSAADLPPTEALFDAINRGDILTARDAVSRGADVDATNLLGLTPLELSIDLSRNDITFLLLSLRGGGGGGAQPARATQQAAAAPPPRRQPVRREPRIAAVAATEAPQPVRQTPALYAGNGGSAVPAAGFLGFDAKR